jgi:predicted membrane protein
MVTYLRNKYRFATILIILLLFIFLFRQVKDFPFLIGIVAVLLFGFLYSSIGSELWSNSKKEQIDS